MRLNRDEIAARIPYAGRMVLLDDVSEWDDEHIVCRSAMHQDRSNPLLVAGQLSSVCAIEFAAQAMAVHGSLLVRRMPPSPTSALTMKPRAGFLASVRNVQMEVARLDDVRGILTIEATRESGDDARVLYVFEVRAGNRMLVSGRAAVVLQMPEPRAGMNA
jgi:predicted hotdog family 3-hydroxylacyl-ACP dehydratase